MRIIIIGASGMIGCSLYQAAKAAQKEVVGTCHNHQQNGLRKFDMCRESLDLVIPGIGPQDTVYLFSGYTNVSWIYNNQVKARELNLYATKRLIDEVSRKGARIIFMSSVEVFDGEHGNYDEDSKPNPLSYYGKMKHEIEQYLHSKKCRSCIVRTGWNVGWDIDSPCVVKLTYKTLISPGAKMAKDNIFSMVDVRDTCEGLLRLMGREDVTVCNLTSVPAVVRTELASMIMGFSRYKGQMSYKPVLFSEIPYPEKRSRNTQLNNKVAVSSLGMEFKPLEMIIRQKVDLLDRNIEYIRSNK